MKWHAHWSENNQSYYARGHLKGKKSLMHRVILGVSDPKVFVDHKNHDTLDNRRENLRLANASQNKQNGHGPYKNNVTAKVRGVSLDRRSGKYRARVYVDGKRLSLGFFHTVAAAAEARAAHK